LPGLAIVMRTLRDILLILAAAVAAFYWIVP